MFASPRPNLQADFDATQAHWLWWLGQQSFEPVLFFEFLEFEPYCDEQFGQTLLSLKERIGVIAPRSRAGEKPLDEPGG